MGIFIVCRRSSKCSGRRWGWSGPAVSSSRLPFYYAMLWPLGRLPYATARALWFGLMILSAVLFVLIYPTDRRAMLAAAVAVSLPLFAATFGQRQDLALLLLIIAVSLWLRKRGYETAAGFVLALLAIKIHLFLLLPVALVMRREWRMLFGLAGGGVALLGISFAVAGPGWVQEYLALISNPGVISDPGGKPNLHGLVAGWPHAGAWEVVLSVLVVIATVLAARRRGFEIAFSAALLGSFLMSNHAYVHDCAVLIPALVEIGLASPRDSRQDRPPHPGGRWVVRGLAGTLITPLPLFSAALAYPYKRGRGSRAPDRGDAGRFDPRE